MTRTDQPLDRRTALRALASTAVGGLAGCATLGGGLTGDRTAPKPPVESISFEAQDMVVRLAADHSVTRMTLVGPDGSRVAGTSVPTGVTTVQLPILSIDPGEGGFDHYQSGDHELVIERKRSTRSMDINLNPSLEVVDVRRYQQGDDPNSYGTLGILVRNAGTAPTWVYDIVYRNAPNKSANAKLIDSPGVPRIRHPKQPDQLVVPPSESQFIVGTATPLIFPGNGSASCTGTVEMRLIAGVAAGGTVTRTIRASIAGEASTVGVTGDYTCSDASVRTLDQHTQ